MFNILYYFKYSLFKVYTSSHWPMQLSNIFYIEHYFFCFYTFVLNHVNLFSISLALSTIKFSRLFSFQLCHIPAYYALRHHPILSLYYLYNSLEEGWQKYSTLPRQLHLVWNLSYFSLEDNTFVRNQWYYLNVWHWNFCDMLIYMH